MERLASARVAHEIAAFLERGAFDHQDRGAFDHEDRGEFDKDGRRAFEQQRDDAAIASILKHAEQIRTAWKAAKVKRRAPKGKRVDPSAEPLDSRG